MPERDNTPPDPKQLLQIKDDIHQRWRQLPSEHQASFGLILIREVLNSEYGGWFLDSLLVLLEREAAPVEIIEVQIFDKAEPGAERPPLLDDETRQRLPPLYSGEKLGLEALAQVKFFTPDSDWTWYASEFDGEDLLFGLVSGFEVELGYFSLSELEQNRGPKGLPIERDLHFQPKTLRELQALHKRGGVGD